MILIDQMKNFKIYKTPTFLPTLEKDKKKKSAIVLLTPDYNSSKSLMNHPLFVNKKRFESYYAERDVSYYIGNKKIEEVTDESTSLLETKRSNLKDSDFGIPEDRKFPLDTEQHVRSAIKLFGHAEESKKPALARKIASRARSYGIQIPETTQVYEYLHEDSILYITDKPKINKREWVLGTNGVENLVVYINKDDKNVKARARAEMLVVKDDSVYIVEDKAGCCSVGLDYQYNVPGGGWDKGESPKDAAIRETNEEAYLNTKDVEYGGCYISTYDEIKDWVKDKIDKKYQWKDYYTEVYIGKYNGKYKGEVDEVDKEKSMTKGKFIKISKIFNKLNPVHQQALIRYFNSVSIKEDAAIRRRITFSKSFSDVKNVVDTLSKEDLSHICNGTFKNSPYVKYREVLLVNKDPAAFIDVYSIPGEMKKNEGAIVCACKSNYRGNGYIELLANRMKKNINKTGLSKLYWETTKSNKTSSHLAKKLGFSKSEDINKDDDNYSLIIETVLESEFKSEITDSFIEDASDHSHIKNVVFDIGGVLVDHEDQTDALLATDIPPYFIDQYIDIYWNKLNAESADVVSAKIAFTTMCEDEEMKAYAPKAFYILSSCVKPLEYVDKMLSLLKIKGYTLYYLSNWSKYSFELCKSAGKMDFLKYFDDGIVSYQIGFEKPDRSIYEIFKEKLGIENPGSCIFFDDRLENIEAARACGLEAVKWDQIDGPGWVLNNLIIDSFNEGIANLFINEAVEDGHKYYLVSDNYLGDNKKVKPSIPKGSLDEKTERIRLYKTINGAMMAKGDKEVNTGRELFVHVPVDEDSIKVSTPSLSQVPNMNLTGEVWVKEEITVKCIGKIRVGKPVKQYSYKLGDKDVTCHSWQYSWLTSQDKHVVDDKQG